MSFVERTKLLSPSSIMAATAPIRLLSGSHGILLTAMYCKPKWASLEGIDGCAPLLHAISSTMEAEEKNPL
jgi:hypothetical protein